MGKKITAYKVKNLSKVNKTLYKEGDVFITNRSAGMLVNNEIKTIGGSSPNLNDYAKKEDIPDVSNFLTAEEIQNMIDESIQNEEGEDNE